MSDCSMAATDEQPRRSFEREYLCQYPCESCNANLGYRVACQAEAKAIQRTEILEQRYQKLEQVAMQAYEWFLGAAQCRWSVGAEEANWMREQLEALGVSVDG